MPEDVGSVRQQIGEILGTVKGLADQLKEVKEDGVRREDRLTSEIRTIKHEQRQADQVITSKMELLTAQFRELDSKARIISEELTRVKRSVEELEKLREPVQKLQALRERVVAYGLVVTTIGGVIWWFVSPYVSEFLHRLFFGAPK
jgi:methyl-accepting chemotaxis protein